MTEDVLKTQHHDSAGRAERLRDAMVVQLSTIFNSKEIALGVPIESRVKSWASIKEKLQRKKLKIDKIFDVQDLIGVRAILLFHSDLKHVVDLIAAKFEVLSLEDTASRLGESEFGYQSQHLVVRLPKEWLSVPSLANLDDFVVELQVRTLAQHIWAAASHKLQYKQEAGVPPPLRRTINRISALLEIVDLEFERVIEERRNYRAASPPEDEQLNVDNLETLLTELLPPENSDGSESYAELLQDLMILKVQTRQQLRGLLEVNLEKARERDRELVEENREQTFEFNPDPESNQTERLARGVYYTHVGLIREALRQEFGDSADAAFKAREGQPEL